MYSTSGGSCFIEATDKATAHSSAACETSADDSRDGWYARLKSGIQGELSGHIFLLPSVAQMFLRAAGHSHSGYQQPAPSAHTVVGYVLLLIVHTYMIVHFPTAVLFIM